MASQSNMTTMSAIQGHSAFYGLTAGHQAAPDGGPVGLTIKEIAHQGKINIRCAKAFHKTLSKIAGIETNLENNRCASTNSRHAVWLSPDELLLLTEAGAEQALAKQIQDSAGKVTVAVNDITDALTSLHLSGPALRDVLAKGCPLDLHKDHFTQGDCAQSTLSHAGITLCAIGAEEMILICRTSFTNYVVSYLCDGALEYGYDLKI